MLIGKYNAQYIGRTMCGFENNHEYIINIDKDIYGYQISGLYDITDQERSFAFMPYACENSIRRYWDIKEDMTEL